MSVALPTLGILKQITNAASCKKIAGIGVVGPWGSAKTLLAVQTAEALKRPLLIIASGRIEAEGIHDDLGTFVGEDRCALFPAWEVLPTDTMSPADDIVAERMNTLKRLATAQDEGHPLHTVIPVRALLQQVVGRKRLLGNSLTLKVGEEHPLDDLLEQFTKMGYTRDIMVEHRGDLSVRGGIVDIFPISSELPYRIEYFGDTLESIRRFEPETQRSIDTSPSVTILPRSEKAVLTAQASEQGKLTAITDYFPDNTLVVFDEPVAVHEEAEALEAQCGESPYYMSWAEGQRRLKPYRQLSLAQVGQTKTDTKSTRISAPTQSITGWAGRPEDFWGQLNQWNLDGYTVQLLCVNTGERRRLHELLKERGYRLGKDGFDLRVDLGRLRAGFTVPADKIAVLSEREIFGRHYIRRKRRRFEAGIAITQFSDLRAGDFIVHVDHGIARYLGLKQFKGKAGDYITLQYSGGDTMYVPVTHIDHVQKYAGGEGVAPKIDKLGGASWAKKKARVKKAIQDMTEELVKLYAARESSAGHAHSPDTPWQIEFEDAFEYDETPDQARAITDMKRDMECPKPMDRLLCGDVGYGKTEVALRGAFKSVMDHKQVAFLAPTTVLSQQHYATFSERLADYPIKIGLLNRFRSAKEQRETINQLKAGEIDIVIGTHRLLSKDVNFKDLGLLIIDEEQRFGVKQKEHMKKLRIHVDVLTLSATPIPRTLHLSLVGVRDMSMISTAPNDRLPIHTCIQPWDENLIREAITRELSRQGQVFFLHNRVQTIVQVATAVRKLVPNARIAIGHGQMHQHELEEVMTAFIDKKIDVLVCTTIIGSGIDIPNANTIIIDRADAFGLSELYQIRGRVGRYKHRAFAYLLIPGDKALSEEAQLRLKALEDFSALGSGFRIAMRDLEIRGCGNLLGAEQSGSIATVGYETYTDLIAEAVAGHQGAPVRKRNLPPFDLTIDAQIPEGYIPTAQQKMTLYRRIAAITATDEIDELTDELQDRFGTPSEPVLRLLAVMRVRAFASELGVQSLTATQSALTITFESTHFMTQDHQEELRKAFGKKLEIAWKERPSITHPLTKKETPTTLATRILETLADA